MGIVSIWDALDTSCCSYAISVMRVSEHRFIARPLSGCSIACKLGFFLGIVTLYRRNRRAFYCYYWGISALITL